MGATALRSYQSGEATQKHSLETRGSADSRAERARGDHALFRGVKRPRDMEPRPGERKRAPARIAPRDDRGVRERHPVAVGADRSPAQSLVGYRSMRGCAYLKREAR